MIMRTKTVLLLTIFVACLAATTGATQSNGGPSQKDWKKICERVANVPFPAEDRPGPKDTKNLIRCNPYELYYGFEEPANPEKARLCAYDEMARPREDGPFNGKAILMTIYANGIGAKRNFDLAIKLACLVDGAPVEVEGRVIRLEDLREKNWQGKNFSLCDDVSSGYLAGFCADHANKFTSRKRSRQTDRLQAKWNNADRKEYGLLRKTADQYFDIRSENEVDQSGTARAALSIGETSSQEEEFIRTLEKLEQKKLPKYSDQQFKDADSRLNTVYQKIQDKKDPEYGTITKKGIRGTQRAWLKYRDAWVRFCAKKYPDCSADSIKTYLTLKRIKELEELLD